MRSSWDNVCLTYTGGPRTVRNKDDCERHHGRELAWTGRVNSGEPLINVGSTNQPKTLRGVSQKGRWHGVRVPLFSYRRRTATGEQAGPPPVSETDPERGKPPRRPQGKATRKGSRIGGGVGEEGESDCRSVLERIGAAGPPRKRADFPLVFPYESAWQTDRGGKADDRSECCWGGLPRRGGLAGH